MLFGSIPEQSAKPVISEIQQKENIVNHYKNHNRTNNNMAIIIIQSQNQNQNYRQVLIASKMSI